MELEQNSEIAHGEAEFELDLPPEYCRYRDEGCELASSCLSCTFARCIYDEPGGKRRWLKRWRGREMARLFTTKGKGIKELALMFGVSPRTVQRALRVALCGATGREVRNNERRF